MWSILPHGEEELKGRDRWLNEVETRFIFSCPKNRHQRKTKAASWCDITVQAAPTHIHFSAPFYSVSFSNSSAENHTNLLIISTHRNWPKKQQPNRRTKKSRREKTSGTFLHHRHHHNHNQTWAAIQFWLGKTWSNTRRGCANSIQSKIGSENNNKKNRKKFPVDRSGLTELVKRLSEKEVELISI